MRTVAERVGRTSPIHSGTTARTEQIRTSLHETCPLSRTNPEWEDQCGNCLQEIGPHAARYRCSEECLDFTYCERCVFMWPLRTSVVESVEVDRNFPPLSTSHPPKPTSHPPMATSPPPTSFHHPLSRMTETPSAPPPPPPADFFAQLPPFQESILKEKAKTEESIAPPVQRSSADTNVPTSDEFMSGSSSSSASVLSAGTRSRGVSRRSKLSQEKRKERWQGMRRSEESSVSSHQAETPSATPAPVYYNFWGPTNVYPGGPPPQQQPTMPFSAPTYPPQYPLQPMSPPQYPPPSGYPAGYSGSPLGFMPYQ